MFKVLETYFSCRLEDGIVYLPDRVLEIQAHFAEDPLLNAVQAEDFDTYIETDEELFGISFTNDKHMVDAYLIEEDVF